MIFKRAEEVGKNAMSYLTVLLNSYRVPMVVSTFRYIYDTVYGPTTYPVCPRCECTLERDYQQYCDRCGQALNWEGTHPVLILSDNSDLR